MRNKNLKDKNKQKDFIRSLFAMGGIVSPEEALNDHNLMMAKAAAIAEDNPYSKALNIAAAGVKMIPKVMSGIKGGASGDKGDLITDLTADDSDDFGVEIDYDDYLNADENQYALGGEIEEEIPVEVEGGEILQTPDGEIQEVEGPRHEEGGVKMDLPEATQVFSDRVLGADGKTMAERKKDRDTRVSKLQAKLDKNPDDLNLKKTLRTTLDAFQKIEEKDLAYMEQMNNAKKEIRKYMFGGAIQKFSLGTKSVTPDPLEKILGLVGDNKEKQTTFNMFDPNGDMILQKEDDRFSGQSLADKLGLSGEVKSGLNSGDTSVRKDPLSIFDRLKTWGESEQGKKTKGALEDISSNTGNILSGIGSYKAMTDTKKTLKESLERSTTNPNFYKDYGKQAEKDFDTLFEDLDFNKNMEEMDLESERSANVLANRTSARGVNTLRAMDTSSQMAYDKAKRDLNKNYIASKLGLKQGKITMSLQNEAQRIAGAKEADINNRQDLAAYYNNLMLLQAVDAQNYQSLGKNLNASKRNKEELDILNQINKNYTYKDGKIVFRGNGKEDSALSEIFSGLFKKDKPINK